MDFREWLLWIAFPGAATTAALWFALVYGRKAADRIDAEFTRWRKLPWGAKAVVAAFALAMIVHGSVKTNSPPPSLGAPLRMLRIVGPSSPAYPTVTAEDVARGWQCLGSRYCGMSLYAMPEDAVMYTNWWSRGAFEDVARVDFGDWSFPFGTNEISRGWAYVGARFRRRLKGPSDEIVAAASSMAAVPGTSRFWIRRNTNARRVMTWENFALNRDTNVAVSAQIELSTTGDFTVRSNSVETLYRRVDDFDWDGDGIVNDEDEDPYRHDGDHYGQPSGWREYVDEAVGFGLANGLYKLTASFPENGFRRTALTVGDETVVVAEPGEYVFLLSKGAEYDFHTTPFRNNVEFSVEDDVPVYESGFMAMLRGALGLGFGSGSWSAWTVAGGGLRIRMPRPDAAGHCCWLPVLQVTSDASDLGPGDSPTAFTAELSDFDYAASVSYYWYSDDGSIIFSSPFSESTEIDFDEAFTYEETTLYAAATIGTNVLVSTSSFTYDEEPPRQDGGIHIDVVCPDALLLNSNRVDSGKIGTVRVDFGCSWPTNGTLSLSCVSGEGKVGVSGTCSWRVGDGLPHEVEVTGLGTSDDLDDVKFRAEFAPDGGEPLVASNSLTVVQVNDVLLPGAPEDGLVVLTGTSVAFDVDVLPAGSGGRLSTMYKVRQLRGNGSYTDWNYAAANYDGTTALYCPSGGIYQVQALVGVGWGAVDERYYRWTSDENEAVGSLHTGELKSFGVCDCQWQKSLRSCAKGCIGSDAYAKSANIGPYGGFSQVRKNAYKCNIFVAHRLRECGFSVPIAHTNDYIIFQLNLPPLANEWGSSSYIIPGWCVLDSTTLPQPGYLAILPRTVGSGHVGIVDFDGRVISAQKVLVTRRSSFEKWPSVVFRKFTEE